MKNVINFNQKKIEKTNTNPTSLLGMPIVPVTTDILAKMLDADSTQVHFCAFNQYRSWTPLHKSRREYWGWINRTFWVDYNTFMIWWENAPDELKGEKGVESGFSLDDLDSVDPDEYGDEWIRDNCGMTAEELTDDFGIPQSMAQEVFADFRDEHDESDLWMIVGPRSYFSRRAIREWIVDRYPEIFAAAYSVGSRFRTAEELCKRYRYEFGHADIVMRFQAELKSPPPGVPDQEVPWFEKDGTIYVNEQMFVSWLMARPAVHQAENEATADHHLYFLASRERTG